MVWVQKYLAVIMSNLLVTWCSYSPVANLPEGLFYHKGILIADCFTLDSRTFLAHLPQFTSISELHLEGFEFDDKNTAKFSKLIADFPLEKLSLKRCNIGNEFADELSVPSSLKSVKLEHLNLSPEGIQTFLDKLDTSLESLRISECSGETVAGGKVSLNLSQFSSLKLISFDGLDENEYDNCSLLKSLTSFKLETIDLNGIKMDEDEWTAVVNALTNQDVSFFGTLKVFQLENGNINNENDIRLLTHLTSFPHLKILSSDTFNNYYEKRISILGLNLSIEHFKLKNFKIGSSQFSNNPSSPSDNLTQFKELAHSTFSDETESFPTELFKKLEYFYISNRNRKFNVENYCFENLKNLSIDSSICPALNKFNECFPVIETLQLNDVYSHKTNPYLSEILSSKTLKHFYLNYTFQDKDGKEDDLKFPPVFTSSIEQLELRNTGRYFILHLFEVAQFPSLKKLDIEVHEDEQQLNLDEYFELLLKSCPQLTSLSIIGISFYHQKLPLNVQLKNLKFLTIDSLNSHPNSGFKFDFNRLFSSLPNLVEFKLIYYSYEEIKINQPTNIQYFTFSDNFEDYDSFEDSFSINSLRYMPNLIRLGNDSFGNFIFEDGITYVGLAYYFKILKEYYPNQLPCEIDRNCSIISVLQDDKRLQELITDRADELPSYLATKF